MHLLYSFTTKYNIFKSLFTLILLRLVIKIPKVSCNPILIVMSFDGFRNDYVNSTLTPNLYYLSSNGVKGDMKSTFVTKTYPNHQSIATGYYQETHGIINNEMFDPILNDTFNVDKSPDIWWDNNVSIPVWIANQMINTGRHSGAMMWPGAHVKYKQQSIKYLQHYDANITWTKRIDMVIDWLTQPTQAANCVFIYYDEPDNTSHEFGPFSDEVMEQVRRADNVTGYLLQSLRHKKLINRANLLIVSDHGMAEIRKERVINLDTFLNNSWYSWYGSSPVWSIQPKSGFDEVVYETLFNASKTMNFTVYRRQEIPQEFHYNNNSRILSLFIMADEGWDIYQNMSWIPKGIDVWGNHGYNNSLPSMRPLFIGFGPAFKSSHTQAKQFMNIDLYPLMCYVLQLFPLSRFPSNGSLTNVLDLLVLPFQTQQYDESSQKWFNPHRGYTLISGLIQYLMLFYNDLVIFFVFGGFGILFFGAICFVCTASVGKSFRKQKPQEIVWDSFGSGLDIDLHSNANDSKRLNLNGSLNNHFTDDETISRAKLSQRPEETLLLLEDEDEDDL